MLMMLALMGLVSIARSPSATRIFNGNRAILRAPVRIFTYAFVAMDTLGMIVVAVYSVVLDQFMSHSSQVAYAILCLSLLRVLWSAAAFWLARHTPGVLTLALLFLVSVLALYYA